LPDKSGITQAVLAASPGESKPETKRLLEIAGVLVRLGTQAQYLNEGARNYDDGS
jgi:hypothetical protein